MDELRDAIKQSIERLVRFGSQPQRLGEQNTKASLIEPVVNALGWDIYDPDEVHREYRRRTSDNPVDYALLLLRTPRLFIEAKGLGENLDDPRWANQTISYAAVAGVEWVVLTDGAEWRVYNAHAPVPVEQKLFRAVRLDADIDAATDLLALLSKENVRANRIGETWAGFVVDRQVHAELARLLPGGEPDPELVSLLGHRLSKLSGDEIRSSLLRVRATFDFPVPSASAFRTSGATPPPRRPGGFAPAVPPAHVTPRPSPSRAPKRRVSPEERRIRVLDLLSAGRLRPGAALHAEYLSKTYRAELLADGRVRYGGNTYTSLSSAGAAVKHEVRGADAPESVTATDGMDFWRGEDAVAGDVVTIKEIRRRAAEA